MELFFSINTNGIGQAPDNPHPYDRDTGIKATFSAPMCSEALIQSSDEIQFMVSNIRGELQSTLTAEFDNGGNIDSLVSRLNCTTVYGCKYEKIYICNIGS